VKRGHCTRAAEFLAIVQFAAPFAVNRASDPPVAGRKKDPRTGKRRNLGTFDTREAAKKHERAVRHFKRQG
jgi:hypothetical protein